MHSIRKFSYVAAATMLVASAGLAATLTWDTTTGDGTTITAGAGTWDLTTTNWNDGVAGNVLWTNGNDALFTGGTITVGATAVSAGTVNVNGTTEVILQGALNNLAFTTLNIATTGAGKLSIKGNTASPGSTITGGTINIANGATLYAAANAVVPSIGSTINVQGTGNSETRGAIRLDGGATLTGAVNLLGNATIGGSSGIITGVISDGGGAFSVTTAATGFVALNLAGNNTYSGGTNIGTGSVRITDTGSNNAFGTGAITFTGSATIANGTSSAATRKTIANAIVINTGATASFDGGWNDLTLSGNISGAGAFTKTSSGNVILTGANSYAGITTVSSGNLWFSNAGALSASTTVTIAAGGSLVAYGPQTSVAAWLASGRIATASAGTLSLDRNSSSAIDFTANGGYNTLGLSAYGEVTYSGALTAGTGGYRFGNTNGGNEGNLNVASNLSGTAGLAKSGSSYLTLSGANTYTGATSITAGTTFLSGSIANTGGITVSGATLAITGSGAITGAGAVTLGISGVLVTNSLNAVGNAGSLIALTGTTQSSLVYTGGAQTTDRIVGFNNASTGGIVTANGTGTLTFSQAATTTATSAFGYTLNGVGSGSFVGITQPGTAILINFNKTGTGNWTLTGFSNLLGGAFRATGGVLNIASTFTSGTGTAAATLVTTVGTGGVLKVASGASLITSTVNTNGILGGWATFADNTWVVTNGNAAAVTGLAAYDISNTWTAGNNADISASNTAGAAASVNSLRFNTALGATLTQTLSGANVVTSGGILVTANVGANDVVITGGTSIAAAVTNGDIYVHQNNTSGNLIISSVIAANGSGGLVKSGAGTLTLSAANTYTGTTFVDEGTLNLTIGGGTGTIRGGLTIAQGATVNVNVADGLGNTQFARVGNIAVNGGTLNLANTGNNSATSVGVGFTGGTLTGMTGSKLDFRNNGAGDTTITTNAAASTALISVGSIGSPGQNLTITTAKGYAASGIDLQISSTIVNAATSIGPGSGTHTLIKSGLGTLLLTGTNTYTGGTTINGGKLITDNISALGAGNTAVTVASGAILQIGNGTANTVTLGASASLVINGILTLNAQNGKITFGSGTNTGSYAFDVTTGKLNLNGLFDSVSGSQQFTLIAGTNGTTAAELAATNLIGYNSSLVSASFAQGVLTVTAVPEPSAYGLLGAGALAGVALVRRRRRTV